MNTPSPYAKPTITCFSARGRIPRSGQIFAHRYTQLMRKKLAVWIASVFALLAAEAQAQLYIDVYPSQSDTNKTLWIFKGSSTATNSGYIRKENNLVAGRNSITAHGD